MSPGKNRSFSLQSVLTSAFLLLVAIVLLFVLLLVVPRVSDMLRASAVERTKETVLQGLSSVDIYIDSTLSALHYATGLLPRELDTDDSSWQEKLFFIKSSRSDITAFSFFLEDGSLAYSTEGQLRISPLRVRVSDWFKSALLWEGTVSYFSLPHVQELFQNKRSYVISASRSVSYTQNGQPKNGVLLMDIDYLSFSQIANGITLGQSGYVYLMDAEGTLVTHPKLPLISSGLLKEDREAVLSATLGITQDKALKRDRTLIVTTVNQTRWRLVGVAYGDEILTLQSAFIKTTAIVLISAALVSLAAAALMAYLVTRPIRSLEKRMRLVEAGDLNASVSEHGFREIRNVSSAFNHMLWRIRQLMDQIVAEQEVKRLHELNALQAQINPHFLYNTLDSIIWMEERGRSAQAVMMVSALAKLFRISISKGRNVILVYEELEHVRNYLIIQQMRFKDKFVYSISCEEELRNLHTIKLIVQPLVENAINHAMDELADRQLTIQVKTCQDDNFLYFEVSDDGVGIPPEKTLNLLTSPAGTSGIGLKNVHERIQLTCGKRYGLTIHSEEDVGTVIMIRLPLNLGGENS
ncbi:MAG: histidine kinase [Clostridiales bacterium]|nr:histidine kinase [Clostridiales bacterium]